MDDKTMLRVGAWAAIIGGILAVVVNIFAPRASSGELGDPTAELNLAASTKGWELVMIGVAVALLILLGAFYVISHSIKDAPARGWAHLGMGVILVGTAIGVALFAIQGELVRGIDVMGAGGLAGAAFVTGALMKAWTLAYFGFGAFLFGVALMVSDSYPTWLGGAAVLAGLVGLVDGFMEFFAGTSQATTYYLFPISSGLLTLVVLYLGVLLLGKASAAT